MSENGEGTTSGRPAAGAAPPPLAADVGVVAALPIEVGFLLDRLTRVRRYAGPGHTVVEGEHAGKVVAVIVGGAGRAAARQAAGLLLDGHRPRWLVSAGFTGALDPGLKRNDAVLPREIVDPDGARFAVDVQVPPEPPPGSRGPRLLSGRLLTVDGIVRTAAEKAALRERYQADLVDMESSAVAGFCAERSVRFLAVRVVSDEAGEDLPREVVSLMTRSGGYLVGSALKAIWRRPSSLKDFLALHNHAQEAADRLADVTLAAVEQLPS
jgi:adenosylhomocysteine nucleosidase